jgi:hypothetical protein
MSNVFQDVLSNASKVEEKLLGPTYPYYNNIRPPNEIGMSNRGTLQQMGRNIDGLINYVEVLVSGKSRASRTGQPLGNKFFLKTGAKCIDKDTNEEVDRYIYVNNVPQGNIPFISSGLGVNFKEFRGLIPGSMSNLNALNPFSIMQSFLSGSRPECQKITLETIDNNNKKSSESHYVTLIDIQNMDPCNFQNRINPITGRRCRETFENIGSEYKEELKMPDDVYAQLYLAGVAGLGIYLLYRIMEKSQ